MKRPNENEFNPYFLNYINRVPDGDFEIIFNENTQAVSDFFLTLPEEKHSYRYAEGKWTPKQVFTHIIDTERIFAYRALVCSRRDNTTTLIPYDDNYYADNTDVSHRSMKHILDEFLSVRKASETLFENISEEYSQFINDVSGNPLSARAAAYIMMGHPLHHLHVIGERYL